MCVETELSLACLTFWSHYIQSKIAKLLRFKKSYFSKELDVETCAPSVSSSPFLEGGRKPEHFDKTHTDIRKCVQTVTGATNQSLYLRAGKNNNSAEISSQGLLLSRMITGLLSNRCKSSEKQAKVYDKQ